MDLVRRSIAQAFARSAVEPIVHLLHPLLADAREGLALREVFPKQAVGVLVGPALPRVVRQREVELHAYLVRDLGVQRELLAAVERHGPQRLPLQGPRHLPAHAFGGLAPAFAADQEAVFAVHERQQARPAGLARDRVALPVPGLAAPLGGGRPLGYLVGHLDLAAPLGRAAAALAAAPEPPLRLMPADAAVEAPGVDAAVDRRVAHGAPSQLEREPALDLLGRPLLFQELVPYQAEHALIVEYGRPAACEPSLAVAPLRGRGAVEPRARVAPELARHRGLVAPYGAGDVGDALPLAAHQHDVLALG